MFEATNQHKKLGLFGDLSEKENEKEFNSQESEPEKNEKKQKKKKNPLFQDKGESNPFKNSALFSGNSLFGNLSQNKEDKKSIETKGGLFSSSLTNSIAGSSLFANSPLFSLNVNSNSSDFLNNTKKEDDSEEDNDNDEDILKPSNSPKGYDPVENKQDPAVKSIYTKKYVKEIESLYELVKVEKENPKKDEEKKSTENEGKKEEKKDEINKKIEYASKYVNRGKGFLSLEYTEEGKKAAIIVFR